MSIDDDSSRGGRERVAPSGKVVNVINARGGSAEAMPLLVSCDSEPTCREERGQS